MIIVVGNHKGGTSKSTLAVNLATELQQQGSKVIILETDPSGLIPAGEGFQG